MYCEINTNFVRDGSLIIIAGSLIYISYLFQRYVHLYSIHAKFDMLNCRRSCVYKFDNAKFESDNDTSSDSENDESCSNSENDESCSNSENDEINNEENVEVNNEEDNNVNNETNENGEFNVINSNDESNKDNSTEDNNESEPAPTRSFFGF